MKTGRKRERKKEREKRESKRERGERETGQFSLPVFTII